MQFIWRILRKFWQKRFGNILPFNATIKIPVAAMERCRLLRAINLSVVGQKSAQLIEFFAFLSIICSVFFGCLSFHCCNTDYFFASKHFGVHAQKISERLLFGRETGEDRKKGSFRMSLRRVMQHSYHHEDVAQVLCLLVDAENSTNLRKGLHEVCYALVRKCVGFCCSHVKSILRDFENDDRWFSGTRFVFMARIIFPLKQ